MLMLFVCAYYFILALAFGFLIVSAPGGGRNDSTIMHVAAGKIRKLFKPLKSLRA